QHDDAYVRGRTVRDRPDPDDRGGHRLDHRRATALREAADRSRRLARPDRPGRGRGGPVRSLPQGLPALTLVTGHVRTWKDRSMPDPVARLAVLIDADNTSPKHAADILDELAQYGRATIKRAYGDWTTSQLTGWKSALNENAIAPVQQFAYTTGKNATDG